MRMADNKVITSSSLGNADADARSDNRIKRRIKEQNAQAELARRGHTGGTSESWADRIHRSTNTIGLERSR